MVWVSIPYPQQPKPGLKQVVSKATGVEKKTWFFEDKENWMFHDGFLRISHGFLRGSHGFWTGCKI